MRMMRELQNSENSGLLRDFSRADKKQKNGKLLRVIFFCFSVGPRKRSKSTPFMSFATLSIGWFLLIDSLLSGCGYQFGRGNLNENYRTISVPYIVGDQKGELTAEVI